MLTSKVDQGQKGGSEFGRCFHYQPCPFRGLIHSLLCLSLSHSPLPQPTELDGIAKAFNWHDLALVSWETIVWGRSQQKVERGPKKTTNEGQAQQKEGNTWLVPWSTVKPVYTALTGYSKEIKQEKPTSTQGWVHFVVSGMPWYLVGFSSRLHYGYLKPWITVGTSFKR